MAVNRDEIFQQVQEVLIDALGVDDDGRHILFAVLMDLVRNSC